MKVSFTKADQYGQKHPIESDELLVEAVNRIDKELAEIPDEDKTSYLQVLQRNPDLLSEGEKLKFLRCEVFNAKLAAKRLVSYWEKRVEIFGPHAAFQKLTLNSASKVDLDTLGTEFGCVVPDASGRVMIMIRPGIMDACTNPRESKLRAFWYLIHAALEDVETQKRGVVILADPRNSKFSLFDRKLTEMMSESFRGLLPMRLSAIHICHPPTFLRFIFPVVKILLGKRLKKRMHVHGGSDANVLKTLGKFGMTKEMLPTAFGGLVLVNHSAWMASEMKRAERVTCVG